MMDEIKMFLKLQKNETQVLRFSSETRYGIVKNRIPLGLHLLVTHSPKDAFLRNANLHIE